MLKTIIRLLAALVAFSVLSTRCATMSTPQGGPKDSLPPRVVATDPLPYTVNFNGKKLTITFNEYVQLKDQQKIFFMSPTPTKKPTLTIKNRSIVVEFRDTLEANTTYRLDFGGSIVDNNEGNKLDGYSFTFSTGPVIDSLMMVGQVLDSRTRDTIIGAFINYFDPSADSTALDSTLYKSRAEAVFRTDSSGYFVADILKEKPYRVYAFVDNNGDQRYQSGTDLVAFLDTTYNPVELKGFSFYYDSVKRRTEIDSLQILFEVFKEKPIIRQNLVSHSRKMRNRLDFAFSAPRARFDSLDLKGIDSSWIIRETSKNGDTVSLWIAPPTAELAKALPDSIYGSFVYMRQDSVMNYVPKREKLNFYSKTFVAKEDKKQAKEKDTVEIKPQLQFKVDASQTLNPERSVGFRFDNPLRKLDSTRIELKMSEKDPKARDENAPPIISTVKFHFDSVGYRHYVLRAPWKVGAEYELMIPAGTFQDITFVSNDTLTSKFTIADPEKYGTITIVTAADTTDHKNYIFELLSGSGKAQKIVQLRNSVHAGDKISFRYLSPGYYQLRIVEDRNGNKEWDTGSLAKREHPERVRVYRNKGDQTLLEAKENWEIVENISFKELFK